MLSKWMMGVSVVALMLQPVFSQDWTTFTATDGLADNDVRSILIDPDGVKWFGTSNGLSRYDGSDWKIYRQTNEIQTLADNAINDLAFEHSSYGPELWIATDNGVSVMSIDVDAVTFATPYRTENRDLVSNKVQAVAVDNAHNRFFGTDAGMSIMQGSEWQSFTAPLQLTSQDILAIGVDNENGWRYICTSGGGANRIKMEVDGITSASPYDYDWSGLYSNRVNDVFVKPNSNQWFATNVGAAYHVDYETKSGWTNHFSEDGLGDDTVQVVIEGADGIAWFGTPTGVSLFDGSTWQRISTRHGLVSNNVVDIAIDTDGSLWFATDQGVSHMVGPFTGVENPVAVPKSFTLHQNYPNPFNPSTHIGYDLAEPGKVMVDIYNVNGQLIRHLVDAYQREGYHEVNWSGRLENTSNAVAGMYIARMHVSSSAGEWTDSRKMLLIK